MTAYKSVRDAHQRLALPLGLTRLGMLAERLTRAFWPLASILLIVLSILMFGLQDQVAVEVTWIGGVTAALGALAALTMGVRRFRWPSRAEASERLDRTLPGRPIAALEDSQAIGAGDGASEAVWIAHVHRMADRTKDAKPVAPDLKLSRRDPYALRYVALVAIVMATLFGSIWRVSSVADLAPGSGGQALAAGPAWEGWVEPPTHTGRPSLYLNDITAASLEVPAGSTITLRLYGEIGSLIVEETVSGRTGEVGSASEPAQSFEVAQDGRIAIAGPGGQEWAITTIQDQPPLVELTGPIDRTSGGEFEQPFRAQDDYGVVAGRAELVLDLSRIDRRYGLALDPEPQEQIVLDLPMPISGDRALFEETLIDDLSLHPWANLPVTLRMVVEDAVGQVGEVIDSAATLPGRRFFDPLASAIIEQRRDLLWNRDNAKRVSQVLRAVSHDPSEIFRSETAFLKLRVAVRSLETRASLDQLSDDFVAETAQVLWDIAVELEDGDLADALERLRRAEDRLSEAMERGATDEEIAELMQELRDAMQDYMRQLAEQTPPGEQNQQAQNQDTQEITGDQLQDMLNQLQELMEQGRMAEAQRLLDQLRQMMENMQIAQGQPGQQGSNPGQEAMEGLAETLRDQQELSDEAFGDLQEQFGQQGQQPGQQQGQQGQEGQQQGQTQPGQGQNRQPGQGQGQNGQQSLADRQDALREQLRRQQQNLPGAGSPEGEAARDALDRAGRAMENAEEALRDEDFAGALDDQAEAMEALREGMRELGEQLAQQQGQPGQQGDAFGEANDPTSRDPLGRETGKNGRVGTDENLLQGEDVYRRARDLLDEIRRRSSDQSRPDSELDYLKRLLDRF